MDSHYFLPLRQRGMYCLMWLEGKSTRYNLREEYKILTKCYDKSEDVMVSESYGSKDSYWLEDYDIPW